MFSHQELQYGSHSIAMLKVVHFADLHLGVENYSHIDPATGLSTSFGDFLSTLDEVVNFALEWEADLVLFCGDAYKNRDPSQTQQREFARRIATLVARDIPVFLLVGNHDLPNTIGRATAVEIFDTLAVRKVTVANHPSTFVIETKSGPLRIVALPWIRRSGLISREENKNLSLEKINTRLEEELAKALSKEVRHLSGDIPTLLAAHVRLPNAVLGSERAMIIGHDPVLLQSNVSDPAFDYVALGHIHKHQVLSYQPPIVYPGSLQRIDFGDEKDEKGFYSVEIDPTGERGNRVTFDFHPVKARQFLTIKVSIPPGDANPLASVSAQISRHTAEIKDSIVRLHLQLPQEHEDTLPESELRRMLPEAQYLTIVKEVKQEHRLRSPLSSAATKMKPIEALQIYLEVKKVSPEHARTLMEYGEKLIQESEPKD